MNKIFTIAMVALMLVFTLGVTLADPNGANPVTVVGSSERGSAENPRNASAIAGNVTELNIVGNTITQTWQGYFGNVSGGIELSDASGNAMYNWSLASPQGEVFASTNSSLDWVGIKCLNTTQITALETAFNIDTDAMDGIDETFEAWATNQHDVFVVGATEFNSTTACRSTEIFDNNGVKTPGMFEEVLLSDTQGNTIFAALLEEDANGFNGVTHDFEMLVLEDGHGTDTDATDYYFYVELE